jgi:uncharacterized alkaline shock family protein YloU
MSEVEGSAPAQSAEAVPAEAAPVAPSATAARGVTSVSDEVVEKIAGTVAREVPGVADLGGDLARFFASVKEKVGLGEVGDDSDRGVSAKVEGNRAVVNVVIVIESGYVVHEVTEAVRVKVIEAVEKFGLEVAEVNVKVDDVELEGSGPAATPA